MRALLTGATGIVGRAVLARLAASDDLEPVAAVRGHALPDCPSRATTVRIAGLSAKVRHPAANQTFLVSDGEDLSTTKLLRRMAQALGKPTPVTCAGRAA